MVGALTLNGNQFQRSAISPGVTVGSTVITSIPTVSGSSVDFDYFVKEDGGAMRGGTVKAVWNISSAAYNDFSTTDIGGSTTGIEFVVDVSGSNVRLNAVVTVGTWTVQVGSKLIF
jgi:hypothetical protein